jgi:hypothetical protein
MRRGIRVPLFFKATVNLLQANVVSLADLPPYRSLRRLKSILSPAEGEAPAHHPSQGRFIRKGHSILAGSRACSLSLSGSITTEESPHRAPLCSGGGVRFVLGRAGILSSVCLSTATKVLWSTVLSLMTLWRDVSGPQGTRLFLFCELR